MALGTPNSILVLVILIYSSPPIFIEIGPKLPKFAIEEGWCGGWGGLKIGPATPSVHFKRFPPKLTSIKSFVEIG